MPTARRCQGCGATLGEPPPGASIATCQFCGLAHDTTAAFPAMHPVVVPIDPRVRKGSRAILFVVLAVVAIIVVSALVPAIMGIWVAKTAIERTVPGVRDRIEESRKTFAPADLATLSQGGGWKELRVAPPSGGFADFDPVASLPWAMAIGRAWASDAVLTRVDVGKVAASGVVELGGEHGSGYRFMSPGRRQRWINETDAGSRSVTATGLMIEIKGTTVRALPHEEREERVPPAAASLPLPEILERARQDRDFVDKPYYAGYLIHLPREGWVWYFRPISGSTGLPRVRARDGRTYPY